MSWHFLPAERPSVGRALLRDGIVCVLAAFAIAACSATGAPSSVKNLIADPGFSDVSQFWVTSGRIELRPGLGPDGSSMLYYPGNGAQSGYRNVASFLAIVEPGKTYTFSAYLDATGHDGTPPYVTIEAVKGTWKGASIFQPEKGRIATTFSIPADSGTTLVRGTFNPENGLYPVGRGAAFSQPQLESGDTAHAYTQGVQSALGAPPPGGNLVVDSDLRDPSKSWQFSGRMRIDRTRAFGESGSIVYDGEGKASGFDNSATFFARVKPGATYTFSMYMDSSGNFAAPPYAFLRAVDGTWAGTQLYQAATGRGFVAFTIPRDAATTLVRGWVNPQNGTYAAGTRLVAAWPQIEAGSLPSAYRRSPPAAVLLPPRPNLVIDSDIRAPASTWRISGHMHAIGDATLHHNVAAYEGSGQPSGFDNIATFFARVTPGRAYTFSAYVDGSKHAGTPPYVFLRAVNGSWPGAQLYAPGWGRFFRTFAIPAASATTCISGTATPQNGSYPRGDRMVFAEPDVEAGTTMSTYSSSSTAKAGSSEPCR